MSLISTDVIDCRRYSRLREKMVDLTKVIVIFDRDHIFFGCKMAIIFVWDHSYK